MFSSIVKSTEKFIPKSIMPKKIMQTAATPVMDVSKINAAANANKGYLSRIGGGTKKSSLDESIEKIAEALISHNISQQLHSMGQSKVALEVLKNEGKDYGDIRELDFMKVACILGTRLAMINRERAKIAGGLSLLKDL